MRGTHANENFTGFTGLSRINRIKSKTLSKSPVNPEESC
jgi:hypothetical protein